MAINRQQAMQINTLANCASTIAEAQSNGASISVNLKVDAEIISAFDSLGVEYSVNETEALAEDSEPLADGTVEPLVTENETITE